MKKSLTFKEKLAFSLAGSGQNMIYNTTTAYIMVFYTDVVRIDPLAVGTLMLISRFIDAVNDPIMGIWIDKRKRKGDKFKPFLKAIWLPMIISTILVYWVPEMSAGLRLVYAYVSYLIWDVIYTISDIPYWGLSIAMSDDETERLSLVSMARILCNVGLAVSIVLPPLMIHAWGGGQKAYLWTAVILAGIGGLLFSLAGYFTHERHHEQEEEKVSVAVLWRNKPFLILQLSRILQAFRMVLATSGLYFAKYNLGNESLFSLLGGTLIASMIIAMIITPKLKERYSKKQLYQISNIMGFISHGLMFVFSYHNFILTMMLLFAAGFSLGLNDVITYTLVGDCVDDYALKTGDRTEGISFSFHTFTTKLQSALGLFWIGLVLNHTGFAENTIQSTYALQGIHSLISLFPAGAALLSMLPMIWFPRLERD